MRERTAWMDVARGLAVCLVILLHATDCLAAEGFAVSPWLDHLNGILEGFRMPTIVMISGLLAAGVRNWTWRDVLRRRVGPLLLLYFVWALIAIGVSTWLAHSGLSYATWEVDWMLLRPEWRMWYLYALPLYIAAARALRGVPTAYLLVAGVILNLVAVTFVFTHEFPGGAQSWGYVMRYWVFFVAAERFAARYHGVAARRSRTAAVMAASAFVGMGVLITVLDVGRNALWLLALGVLGTAFTLTVVPFVGESRAFAWARAIGRRTLGVYAQQIVVTQALGAVLAGVVPLSAGAGFALPIATAIVAVGICYGTTMLLLRWAPVPFLRPWWNTSARPQMGEPRRATPIAD